MTTPNNQPKHGAPYTGPAKPIPTHRELVGDKALLIWFAVLAVVFLTMLALGLLEG